MVDEKTGLTSAIRKVLREADDSLTAREIIDTIEASGIQAANTSAILRQRCLVGEVIKSEIRGQCAYTLNPEFEQPKPGPRRGRPPNAPATSPPSKPVAAKPSPKPAAHRAVQVERIATHAIAELAPPRLSTMPPEPIVPLDHDRAPAPEIDPALQRLKAAITAATSPESALPRGRPPLALGERLDAIANDLEEAIADACDAQLAHGLIKAVVLASGATHRALQKLAA